MAEPMEFWTVALAKVIVFGFGMTLTALSYYAYRANQNKPSFGTSTIGFAVLTIGAIIEPIYQLGFKSDPAPSNRELIALQTAEGVLIALGLGLLFYSIYVHNSRSRYRYQDQAEQLQRIR